ncbi:MAG TPA: CHAD domain-containing protein [Terriglobales bacterium]|nr:CHAD domain-containing protein [Terriglobales bacterium]
MVKRVSKMTGLRYWMLRALEECDHVSVGFSADPVHDLRVALRRCRSMADGMMAMDPDPDWKAMKKAGKRLFQRLGDLRDVQIMMEWIERLHPKIVRAHVAQIPTPAPDVEVNADGVGGLPAYRSEPHPEMNATLDPAAQALLAILRHRESQHKHEARTALDEFDRKEWRQWARTLPQRAARIRPGSTVFKHLALERWTAARELHTRALRNRSQVAFHTLRIGIKRFRYIVENFLPAEHKAWSDDLKHMQDLLGEVHDLDVLWATALTCHVFADEASRKAWHARILEERGRRIDEYRERTVGPNSLWGVWRSGLPRGKQVQQIAMQRMKLWARALDPDFAHSERVARLSLELYDGLSGAGLLGLPPAANGARPGKQNYAQGNDGSDARSSLYAAALLHDVGKSKGEKNHHKESLDLINRHGAPLGWNEKDVRCAAVVARFHCGALPTRGHKNLRDLLPDEQTTIIRLAAILRLANAMDAAHDGHILRVKIENPAARFPDRKLRTNGFVRKPAALAKNEALVIGAEGYTQVSAAARAIAGERFLLETVLHRPVVVTPMKNAG